MEPFTPDEAFSCTAVLCRADLAAPRRAIRRLPRVRAVSWTRLVTTGALLVTAWLAASRGEGLVALLALIACGGSCLRQTFLCPDLTALGALTFTASPSGVAVETSDADEHHRWRAFSHSWS